MIARSLFTYLKLFGGAVVVFVGSVSCANQWGLPHEDAVSMTDRPECPTRWGDSIPWFKYTKQTVTLAGYQSIPGGVPGTGPITDIPEFNDCQRFVMSDEQRFDSLFAIFAGFKQDSISRALEFDNVDWKTSDTAVAQVTSTGVVTGVSPGTATISARSLANPAIIASRDVVVELGAVPATSFAIDLGLTAPDTIVVTEQRHALSPLGAPTIETLPVATIYSYGQFYTGLGIEPNFNCVYLYFDGSRKLSARVIPAIALLDEVNACRAKINPNSSPGTKLTVARTMLTGSKGTEYPPVARWDWQSSGKTQYFGLGCAIAWCEFGVTEPPTPHVLPPGATADDQRVVSIKGWHDEQVLAVPDPGNPEEQIPSFLRGTVIPHPDLRTQGWTETSPPEWRPAAYIAIRDLSGESAEAIGHYRKTLNIDLAPIGPLKEMNEMAYCYGRFWKCGGFGLFIKSVKCDPSTTFGKRWWVRITPAPSSDMDRAEVYCLIRRTHTPPPGTPAFVIPSAARWRWIIRDDTVWTECALGCCETSS